MQSPNDHFETLLRRLLALNGEHTHKAELVHSTYSHRYIQKSSRQVKDTHSDTDGWILSSGMHQIKNCCPELASSTKQVQTIMKYEGISLCVANILTVGATLAPSPWPFPLPQDYHHSHRDVVLDNSLVANRFHCASSLPCRPSACHHLRSLVLGAGCWRAPHQRPGGPAGTGSSKNAHASCWP